MANGSPPVKPRLAAAFLFAMPWLRLALSGERTYNEVREGVGPGRKDNTMSVILLRRVKTRVFRLPQFIKQQFLNTVFEDN
jgi:hypothetical protein